MEPLGERAYLVRRLGAVPAHAVAAAIMATGRVEEATPAYDTVGVYVGKDFDSGTLRQILEEMEFGDVPEPKRHHIPVCYELGADFEDVCRQLSLRASEVIRHHSTPDYTCFAIGFSPGFPFLGYLSDALSGLPRRASPRTHVPPGSVGITGRQTGVYPGPSPGGWNLIGRTPLTLVDLDDAYFPISAGDWVKFEPISAAKFDELEGQRL